jgi:hypothetical protein
VPVTCPYTALANAVNISLCFFTAFGYMFGKIIVTTVYLVLQYSVFFGVRGRLYAQIGKLAGFYTIKSNPAYR